LEWTGKLNPDLLDTTPFTFKDREGKEREIASKREQYYMLRTRVLLEQGLWDECIAVCQKALESFDKLHYDNDVWFMWRIALCHEGAGQKDIALRELKKLLTRKSEWFIQKEIAGIYFTQDKPELALQYAIDSALNFGESSKKVNLYHLMVTIFESLNKPEEAKKQVELTYQVKKINGYRIDENTLALVSKYKIDPTKSIDLKTLEREMKQFWEGIKYEQKEKLNGTIKTILPNRKAGFVITDNNKSYFFRMKDFRIKPELAKEGQKVSFFLEEGFDAKKNQKTQNAVNLRIRV
jgi:tetratricopeptide (TPR) repeat protein/cold shock CspA family protein